MAQYINQVGYGLTQALNALAPFPIIAKRAPNTSDKAPIGTLWVFTTNNALYCLTSITGNAANWILVQSSASSGIFTTLTSSGNTTLGTDASTVNTFGSGSGSLNTIGSIGGASGTTILVGTGNFTLNGVGASIYDLASSTTTGTITFGGSAQTGAFSIGNSTGAMTLNLLNGVNAGAQVLNIASNTPAANTTVNVLTSAASAGTQTFNLFGSGSTRAGVVNIGTGNAAHAVNISTSGTGLLSLGNATGNTNITGNVIVSSYVSTPTLYASGDLGGAALTSGFTNATVAAGGTGGFIIRASSGAGTTSSAGFLKFYVGSTAVYVPYWTQTT